MNHLEGLFSHSFAKALSWETIAIELIQDGLVSKFRQSLEL